MRTIIIDDNLLFKRQRYKFVAYFQNLGTNFLDNKVSAQHKRIMKLKNRDFSEVKTIIFDYGNVLMDIDISLTVEAFKKLGIDRLNPEDIHPNNVGVFHAMEVGSASTQDFIDEMKNFSSNPEKISDEQIIDAWNALLLPFDKRIYDLLDDLRQNHKVMLLSNTNKAHHDFFEAKLNRENPTGRKFKSYFDNVFYSDELQMRKPEREIYQKVQDITGLDPLTTLFIDDNAPNLVEPKAMGWKVYNLVKPEVVFDLFE